MKPLPRISRKTRRIDSALPGIDLPPALVVSTDAGVLEGAGIVLFAMPSQAQRDAAQALYGRIGEGADVVICAKGMERDKRPAADRCAWSEELHLQNVAVLSGPGFAADIAKGLPTAMVIAAETLSTCGRRLPRRCRARTFRLYPSDDRIGVQLGGALKNVLAIACGIVEGAGLGDSARAALISRGLAEMSRFVAARGGDGDTVRGLSGLGDLVLTATSHQSRNLRYGIALGRERQRAGRDAANWSRAPLPPPSPPMSPTGLPSKCR